LGHAMPDFLTEHFTPNEHCFLLGFGTEKIYACKWDLYAQVFYPKKSIKYAILIN
jgi:hypothetical protein